MRSIQTKYGCIPEDQKPKLSGRDNRPATCRKIPPEDQSTGGRRRCRKIKAGRKIKAAAAAEDSGGHYIYNYIYLYLYIYLYFLLLNLYIYFYYLFIIFLLINIRARVESRYLVFKISGRESRVGSRKSGVESRYLKIYVPESIPLYITYGARVDTQHQFV